MTSRPGFGYSFRVTWPIVYFIIAVVCGLLGVWFLARNANFFASLAPILWFLYVLFEQYLPRVSGFRAAAGFPTVGALILYLLIPVCLIASFFAGGPRR